jgi:hypothetical protein
MGHTTVHCGEGIYPRSAAKPSKSGLSIIPAKTGLKVFGAAAQPKGDK